MQSRELCTILHYGTWHIFSISDIHVVYYATYVAITCVLCNIFSTYGISCNLERCHKMSYRMPLLVLQQQQGKTCNPSTSWFVKITIGCSWSGCSYFLVVAAKPAMPFCMAFMWISMDVRKNSVLVDPPWCVTRKRNMCINFSCARYTEITLGYDTGNRNGENSRACSVMCYCRCPWFKGPLLWCFSWLFWLCKTN